MSFMGPWKTINDFSVHGKNLRWSTGDDDTKKPCVCFLGGVCVYSSHDGTRIIDIINLG